MADRLTLTRALEESGIESPAAERIATEIYEAIHGNVATKTDLAAAQTDIKTDITAVRSDLREMEQRLDLRFEQLDRRIDAMVMRLGGITVIGVGVLIAIKYIG